MKPVEEITCLTIDYGSFICLADKMGEKVTKSYYYSPYEDEFRDIKKCVKGEGLEKVERLDNFMEPEILKEIDLVIVPDIGYGGLQRHLKDIGKAVWGSMGASDIELYRTQFLKVLKKLGLSVVHSEKVVGLTALAEYLKGVEDVWVKINRFRENMETWHHQDYAHSQRVLEKLAVTFGPLKERIVFVVQDSVPDAREIGYDGMFTNGEFPEDSFQGYEKKNELYLGSCRSWKELPEAVRAVNEAFVPELSRYGYCNFWATEIRWLSDDEFYFIDPTARMPGQTGEQTLETCDNLPEVIWQAANGNNIPPVFNSKCAAEATMHYTAGSPEDWKTIGLPDQVKAWAKLYHYCEADGLYHFPPHKSDELGVLMGVGDTVQEAIDHLKENAEVLKDEPIRMEMNGFVDLLKDIEKAEEEGMEFSDKPLPEPATVIE